MKRVLSLVLVLMLVVGLVPARALAADDAETDYTVTIHWQLENTDAYYDTVSVTETPGNSFQLYAPEGHTILSAREESEAVEISAEDDWRFTMPEASVTFVVTVAAQEEGDNTAQPAQQYAIALADAENGSVSTSVAQAEAGQDVTVEAVPGEGYELVRILATWGGEDHDITEDKSFTMPGEAVTVSAAFQAVAAPVSDDVEPRSSVSLTFSYGYDVYRDPAYPKKGSSFSVYYFSKPLGPSGSTSDSERLEKSGTWTLTDVGTYGSIKSDSSLSLPSYLSGVVSSVADKYSVTADNLHIYRLTRNNTYVTYGALVVYNPGQNPVAVFFGGNYYGGAGYFFCNQEKSYDDSLNITVTNDASDENILAAPTITVTFSAGEGSPQTQTAQTGTNGKLSELPEATRSGYTLEGWYDAQTGGNKVTLDTVFTGNTTVYARWKPDVTLSAKQGLTYDGTEKELVTTASAPTGAVIYYARGENSTTAPSDEDFSTAVSTGLNAGTYYVWYYGMSGGIKTDVKCVTATIGKGAVTGVQAPEGNTGLDYNGTEQPLISAGDTDIGTMLYAVSTTNTAPADGYKTAIPTAKDAGTYYVWYYVQGGDNYEDTPKASVTVTVAPLVITVKVNPVDREFREGDQTVPLEFTIQGVLDGETVDIAGITASVASPAVGQEKKVTVTYNNPHAAGSHGGNYQIAQDGITLEKDTVTIRKAQTAAPAVEDSCMFRYTEEKLYVQPGYEVLDAAGNVLELDATRHVSLTEYLGQTLQIRKLETDNYLTSPCTKLEIASRPGEPAVTVTAESTKNQGDGKITGLDTTMQYSTDNGTNWTNVTVNGGKLENLAAGTVVLVRTKASADAPVGQVRECEIPQGPAITVTFDANGKVFRTAPEAQADLGYGDKVKIPAEPQEDTGDFVFTAWYEDEACQNVWDFASETVTQDRTLYAKWEQVRFDVAAAVNGSYTGSVNVKLMQGSDEIASLDTGNGQISFAHIPAGLYNIVVTYKDSNNVETTKTEMITVPQNETYSIELPQSGTNSSLSVVSNNQIPNRITVDKLDEEAESQKESGSNDSVAVEMVVTGMSENQVSTNVVANVEDTAGRHSTVQYLDITVTKQINDDPKEKVPETNQILEIIVPCSAKGMKVNTLKVFREHQGDFQEFEQYTGTVEDGRFYHEDGYLHIFAKRFSTYAISYEVEYKIKFDPNGGKIGAGTAPVEKLTAGDGSITEYPVPTREHFEFKGWFTAPVGGTRILPDHIFTEDCTVYAHWGAHTVTVEASGGGTASANPTEAFLGEQVAVTVSPAAGYKLSTLIATDANGENCQLYTDNDGHYTFTMPDCRVTVKATFAAVRTANPDTTNPKTGDAFPMAYCWGMMVTTMLALAVLALNRKKFGVR